MNSVIKLNDFISCRKGVTPEEAEPIYRDIVSSFQKGDTVTIDFEGVEMVTTAFLNVVIGDLYKDYTSGQLKERLLFQNLSSAIALRIKKVTDNAKLFYKDEKVYAKTVEDVMNGVG